MELDYQSGSTCKVGKVKHLPTRPSDFAGVVALLDVWAGGRSEGGDIGHVLVAIHRAKPH